MDTVEKCTKSVITAVGSSILSGDDLRKVRLLVAKVYGHFGDLNKTVSWFLAVNPMLGDISPVEMIRLGQVHRLGLFVEAQMAEYGK